MGNYQLTISDIKTGINRCLTEIYASVGKSDKPGIYYVVGGPGSGKTGIERYIKKDLKEQGETSTQIGSDFIATFHPNYEEILENELPEDCYTLTRQFVRPAAPRIFEDIRKNRINLINENTFDKGQSDIDSVKEFKDAGYRISVNIMATDIFLSRLSCFEREAAMLRSELIPRGISSETQKRMYNSFVSEIQELQRLGLCDELNVYARGENINKPRLVYSLNDLTYRDFYEAIISARNAQRNGIIANSTEYLLRLDEAKRVISEYGTSEILTQNSLKGIEKLREDFIREVYKEKIKD